MKRILLIPALCGLMIASFVIDTGAWDLPAIFDLLQVKFNHNTSSSSSDAITIQSGYGSDIVAPEWYNDGATNNKCAYIKSTVSTVKANFYCDEEGRATFDSLKIETFRSIGDYDWHLNSTKVTFITNESGYISFQANSVPTTVGSWVVGWSWRIIEVDGVVQSPAKVCGGTTHNYYTILSEPQTPMSKPWTQVLDYTCSWASGETTDSGAATDITRNLYSNFGDQDGDIDYTFDASIYSISDPYYRNFYLTSFLDSLSISSNVYVNCNDMANLFAIYSAAIGIESETKQLKRNAGTDITNVIDPIGSTYGEQTATWNNHQYGWLDLSKVYDAVLKFESETYPPTNMTQGDYDNELGFDYDTSNHGLVYLRD